jgi:curli biogenesis system outer membrane secretion channel CsgG
MSRTFGKHGLSAGLALYSNTPMEKAIRTSIIEAVAYITQSIPLKYYKY